MNREELDRVLATHKLWLKSGGSEGKRADLRDADLQREFLHGMSLQRANLCGTDLQGAYLRRADLWEANLQKANLKGANLQWANLKGAEFDTSIRNCLSFYGAKFTPDALPWLILHPKWSEMKDSVQISHG